MIFRQIALEDLGCASYLVGDEDAGVAAVVDPRLDIGEYLRLARYLGVHIEHILETHNHADHVSGHGRLAAATGALIHIHSSAGAEYEHEPFEDGWELALGSVTVRALHTPGHRPEHTAFALIDHARGPEPWAVLTGDSLFVGDIARPDLAVEKAEGARGIFGSLRGAAGARRRRRGLAGPSRRLALRRAGDGPQGQHDDRLRAPPQRAPARSRRGRLRRPLDGQPAPAAAELQGDRGDQHEARWNAGRSMPSRSPRARSSSPTRR